MATMSIREFNANTSKAIARAERGEVISITRNGKPAVKLVAEGANRMDDPAFRRARQELLDGLKTGIAGLSGPASYEERTGR